MSPITAQEAYDLTDPSLPDNARETAASNIMAGVAANDAYLSSRPQLEQIMARAAGAQIPPSHAELNPTIGTAVSTQGTDSIAGTVTEYPETNTITDSPRFGDHYRIVTRDNRTFHVYPDMGSGHEEVYEIVSEEGRATALPAEAATGVTATGTVTKVG